MPLQKSSPIDVPFATGLGQKSDSRLLQMGSQTSLVNGVIDKTGAISKRPGMTLVSSTAISPNGNQLATTTYRQRLFRNATGGLGLLSGRRYWARAPGKDAWSDIDDVRSILATRYGIITPADSITSYDVATYTTASVSYAVIVYCEATTVRLILFDLNVNAVVFGPAVVDAVSVNGGDECKVCVTNGKAIIAYQTAAGVANIRAKTFDLAAWTFAGPSLLAATCVGRGQFDVCAVNGAANAWVLAWQSAVAATANNVGIWDSSLGVVVAAVNKPDLGAGSANRRGISVHATTGENVWLAYAYDNGAVTGVRCIGLSPATLATTTADGLMWTEVATQFYRLGIERENSTTCVVTGSILNGVNYYSSRMSTTGPSGLYVAMQGYAIASKPFTIDGRICATVVQTSLPSGVTSGTYLLVDVLDGAAGSLASYMPPRPIATIAPRIVTANQAGLYGVSFGALASSTRALVVGSIDRAASGGTGIDLIDASNGYGCNQTAQLGDVVYCSGGTPQELDGVSAIEMGFLHSPTSASATAVAGGALAVGSYYYAAVFEYRDAKGQRTQSAPLFFGPGTTAGANLQLSVVVSCLHATQRQNTTRVQVVGVVLYRTTVGAGASGVYYRVYSGSIATGVTSDVRNATVTYVDNNADASLTTNEILNTAALVPGCPSSLSCLVSHNGRLVGVADDGVTLQWSTKWDGGSTVPYFGDDLLTYVPDGGRITALASMDGQLVVFKRDAIYVIAGDGPDNNGNGSTWADPRRIPSDVGCTTDWRSVLAMPQGVIFQSEKKFHILTRGLEVQYLSQPVEDTLTANPTVLFTSLHSRRDEVRIGVAASDGVNVGYVINWNYVTGCWSVFDYWDINVPALHAAFVSAISLDGVWYGVTKDAQLQVEATNLSVTGAYKDGANWVTLSVESAWVKAAGIQGWGRFWYAHVSAENSAPHDLTMSVGQDFGGYTQTATWTAAQIAAWTTPLEEAELHIGRQKASAIRVMLSDGAPTGVASTTGAGPRLLGIALEVGLYSGGKRLPPSQGA